MAAAKTVGKKLGRGVGWVGATLWTGTCLLAEATGELGEGFLEGAEEGYEERTAKMIANDAARKARRLEIIAQATALHAAKEASVPMAKTKLAKA